MNLDDIKDIWEKDQLPGPGTPSELPQLTSARSPLDRIRKNMKNELYAQVVAVILMGFFPYHFEFRQELIAPFFALYAVVVAITAYFMIKYYFLYKKLSNNTLSSKDHLYALYFDIRLNMEIYKAFAYSLVPFILIFIGMIVLNKKEGMVLSARDIYIIVGTYIMMMALIAVATSAWVNYFYGKYARQIKGLIDELKEE